VLISSLREELSSEEDPVDSLPVWEGLAAKSFSIMVHTTLENSSHSLLYALLLDELSDD